MKYVIQDYTCHSWRSPVRTRSSVRRKIQNSYVSGFQSTKSSRRKEARPRWLKYGGLPHSDRSIFHEDMTKERCRMTLRWISVNQSLSRYKRSSSDFMKSYVLLRYFVRIDRSPTVPSYSLGQARRINNYVCFARNIEGLINRLSAFIWEGRDRDVLISSRRKGVAGIAARFLGLRKLMTVLLIMSISLMLEEDGILLRIGRQTLLVS